MIDLSKLYYVNVGANGTFTPSGNPTYNTTPQNVDEIFLHLEDKGIKHIALYFHGGLVNAEHGMAGADEFRLLLDGSHVHPISFVWETGPFETIKQNLATIYKTKLFQKILERVLKVGGKMAGLELPGSRGFGSLSYEEIRLELQKDAPFDSFSVNKSSRSINVANADQRYLMDEIQLEMEAEMDDEKEINASLFSELTEEEIQLLNIEEIAAVPSPGARGFFSLAKVIAAAVRITYRVVKRVVEKRDHQPYPTVIEELCRELLLADAGVWLWGNMKKKAKHMWKLDPEGVSGVDAHTGNYLLTKLQAYCAKHPETVVDLVGHSAGSIAICEMIKTLMSRQIDNIKIRNILFLAPACRCDLFQESIIPYSSKISSFRMFTMNDQLELDDHVVKVLYPNSLLYLISGILEPNEYDAYILGMQRYLLDHPPYNNEPLLEDIMIFLGAGPNRTVYAKTVQGALDGLITDCRSHGGFNDANSPTMKSIQYILKN